MLDKDLTRLKEEFEDKLTDESDSLKTKVEIINDKVLGMKVENDKVLDMVKEVKFDMEQKQAAMDLDMKNILKQNLREKSDMMTMNDKILVRIKANDK